MLIKKLPPLQLSNFFGKKLMEVRKFRHMTQKELGERCEFSRIYIGELECGNQNCSMNALCKIAIGLNCQIVIDEETIETGDVFFFNENGKELPSKSSRFKCSLDDGKVLSGSIEFEN